MSDLSKWLRSGRDWPEGTEAGMLAAANELDDLRAEVERLRAMLVDALAGLHNDFEPDNQSARYKRILAGLKSDEQAAKLRGEP